VKDQPKWSKAYPIEEMMNKRNRLNASGAYSSSNQNSEDADPTVRCRPPGCTIPTPNHFNHQKFSYSASQQTSFSIKGGNGIKFSLGNT
jgi:hypothetical protein